MAGYVKSIIPIIESKYDNFTQVEKCIADFFLKNRDNLDFSAKNIAELLFVSEASLSRFAKKCGFHGYREFIYQYEECLSESERKEAAASNTRTVLNIYQDILNKTYNLMDEGQVMRIVHYMNEAERVFVCGKGSSGLAASEMEVRFMRIGVDIDSLQDTDRMKMQAVFQDKYKLVFGISLSGETEEIIYLLQESYKRGAKTVLLTASNMTSFQEFCSEVVLVPSLKYLNHGNIISPQFPILVMIDILYYYYVNQDKYGKEILHDNTLRALKEGKRPQRMIE
ncbi:MurR/RpiR family transcriptional regulator [Acetivibrio ethanolgignens]|uniref:RpiR family transcriptional regulator n=1 Tax=Acetivibrio ethanolgignens TaxID=290052 RepID=A0A0V8QGJ6_9FIRM|nr:MurR/RpiR family transcriptional regulator [Acetivibrio ethanolgignens]KSV59580.1 RpiR family transcriptional regulator [Acetivibrio ethanolgignens]